MVVRRDRMGWLGSAGRPVGYGIVLCVLMGVGIGAMRPLASTTSAQDATLEDEPASTAASPSSTRAGELPTLMELFWASGTIGIVITILSMIAVGFVVEHLITIRRQRLIPDDVIELLEPMISQGRLDEAIEFCSQPDNESLVCEVVLAGLERYRGSEFGFADYKSAIEEAGEEYTSKLYRKTEVLNVVATIAPMLGLLGTVQGMILAFNTIASKGGMARPDELAGSISLALVTTFEGLVVAIPAMVASSFFRNRIDSLVSEGGKRVERLTSPLSRRRA